MTAHAPTVKSSIHSASNVCEYAKVIAYLKKVPIKPGKQVGVCLRWLTGGFHKRIYTLQRYKLCWRQNTFASVHAGLNMHLVFRY